MSRPHRRTTDVLPEVRAAFILKGTTLTAWCRQNGLKPQWAWNILQGRHLGAVSLSWRRKMIEESGADLLHREAALNG